MPNIKSRECRFVYHIKKGFNNPDTHVIKEILHYTDGTSKKNLRVLENFHRPFWVTKEHYRNHKQKKESESVDKLLKGSCTESELGSAAACKLGARYVGVRDTRTVKMSPYLYGVDVDSRTYITHLYQEKYSDIVTPYDVCVLDLEVNVITNEITILTIATKEKIFTVITKQYLQAKMTTKDDVKEIAKEIMPKLEYLYEKHIPKTDISNNVSRTYQVAEDELDGIRILMAKAHEWEPDFMVVWNIKYDMGKLLEKLEKYNVDPADIFCSPKLPKPLKKFAFKLGPEQKVTASGKYTPINVEAQWHTVICPASFYWIDAMCAHRYIRVGGKSIPGGYGLNNILKYELGDTLGKLTFDNVDNDAIKGVDWHKYMTAEHPLEYITYNQWDVLSVLTLDDKTGDLKQVLPMLSGISNFDVFSRGPKRIVDAMHFYYLENNRVLSTKDPVAQDSNLLGLGSWITLLPSYRLSENGAKILASGSNDSNIRQYVFDADQISGYPSNTRAANVSTDTTLKELASIEGMELEDFRTHNINLLSGGVNALSYGSGMFGLPTAFELLADD